MRVRFAAAFCAVVLPAFVGACGGGEPPPPSTPPAPTESPSATAAPAASAAPSDTTVPTPSASASAAPVAGGPPKTGDWDTWSKDQKLDYMKTAVMPKMGGLFHDFDSKRYAEPKCVLCHGSAAKNGSFTMPNPELPKLDVTPAGFKAMQAKKGPVVDFMVKQVVPTMANLLAEPEYDPSTQKGFGCLNCHTKKK